jgi:hypothetical protein
MLRENDGSGSQDKREEDAVTDETEKLLLLRDEVSFNAIISSQYHSQKKLVHQLK